ncbi:MAG: hypothetical protein JRE40_12145 [Deltaproteobacteria bacterium]|nr:hypothetical protein [Deltaproteobacteria bacterium]
MSEILVLNILDDDCDEEGACEICNHWDKMTKTAIYKTIYNIWEHYICDVCAEILRRDGKIHVGEKVFHLCYNDP